MSGLAGPSAAPVVLSLRRLELVIQRVQVSFTSFSRTHDTKRIGEDVRTDAIPIPFGRADEFGESVDHIVDALQENLADNVPRAIRTAQRSVIATIRADIAARVQAGDVVLR